MNNTVNKLICNLLVIRSPNIHRAVEFYKSMGMNFVLHSHGKGPEHYAAELPGFVFEIYPEAKDSAPTTGTRIGFRVAELDRVVENLAELGGQIVSAAKQSPWGRRAVVRDLDGHTIELLDVCAE